MIGNFNNLLCSRLKLQFMLLHRNFCELTSFHMTCCEQLQGAGLVDRIVAYIVTLLILLQAYRDSHYRQANRALLVPNVLTKA